MAVIRINPDNCHELPETLVDPYMYPPAATVARDLLPCHGREPPYETSLMMAICRLLAAAIMRGDRRDFVDDGPNLPRGAPCSAVPVGGRHNRESPETRAPGGSNADLTLRGIGGTRESVLGLTCGDPPLPKRERSPGKRFNSLTWEKTVSRGWHLAFWGGVVIRI